MTRAIFFLAFVVAAKAMFGDLNEWLEAWQPLKALPGAVRELLLHVPYALLAALLLTRAEIWGRLPAGRASIAACFVLVILAVAELAAPCAVAGMPRAAAVAGPLVTLALLAALVVVCLRLTPKPGFIYEGSGFPAVRAFIAFTLLLALSIDFAPIVTAIVDLAVAWARMPAHGINLALSALVVAAFVVTSGLRFRSLQPNPAVGWLMTGILFFLLAVLVVPAEGLARTYGLHRQAAVAAFLAHGATIAIVLRALAHVMLFIGAFYLVSHVLPPRDRIARM